MWDDVKINWHLHGINSVSNLDSPHSRKYFSYFEKLGFKLGPILSPKIRAVRGFGEPQFLGHGS